MITSRLYVSGLYLGSISRESICACATGPQYMVSPALIRSSWWKSAKVSARGWWMVQARVRPRSAKRRSAATT